MSVGAVHRRLWTSLCSCKDVFCSPGQRRLHAGCVQRHVLGVTVQITVEVPPLHVEACCAVHRRVWTSLCSYRDVSQARRVATTGFFSPDSAEHCLEVYRFAVQTVQKTGDSVVQFGMVVDMPVGVPTTGYGSDSTENGGVVQRRRT